MVLCRHKQLNKIEPLFDAERKRLAELGLVVLQATPDPETGLCTITVAGRESVSPRMSRRTHLRKSPHRNRRSGIIADTPHNKGPGRFGRSERLLILSRSNALAPPRERTLGRKFVVRRVRYLGNGTHLCSTRVERCP